MTKKLSDLREWLSELSKGMMIMKEINDDLKILIRQLMDRVTELENKMDLINDRSNLLQTNEERYYE